MASTPWNLEAMYLVVKSLQLTSHGVLGRKLHVIYFNTKASQDLQLREELLCLTLEGFHRYELQRWPNTNSGNSYL